MFSEIISNYLDNEGFLQNYMDWSAPVAKYFAYEENIIMNIVHWQIVWILRGYFKIKKTSPNIRLMLTLLKSYNVISSNDTLLLYRLFPISPLLQAIRLAGLPKPISLF